MPFPSPRDLPDSGVKSVSLVSPALAGRLSTTVPPGKDITEVNTGYSLILLQLLVCHYFIHLNCLFPKGRGCVLFTQKNPLAMPLNVGRTRISRLQNSYQGV